ncbi:hypothetical protein B0J14DRAFT_587939 [Halenospora varia]|nr:hypothetical protein B0J14DRAFT_587939 [Halenospora varia]
MAEKYFSNFPRFGDLPLELRSMIWEAALPEPRLVEIRHAPLKLTVREWNTRERPEDLDTGRAAALRRLAQRYPLKFSKIETPQSFRREAERWVQVLKSDTYTNSSCITMGRKNHMFRLLRAGITASDMCDLFGESVEANISRLVRLTENRPDGVHDFQLDRYHTFEEALDISLQGLRSTSAIPSPLLACRESNENLSGRYQKAFATEAAFPETYFDFDRDILYIRYDKFGGGPYKFKQFLGLHIQGLNNIEDFRKVKNLAIYIDSSTLLDPNYDDRNDSDPRLCRWAANLIEVLFRQLENFTFVLQHHESSTEKSDGSYVLIDPIDIDKTISNLEYFIASYHRRELDVTEPENARLILSRLEVNMKELHDIRTARMERGGPHWEIPEVHYKIAVRSDRKAKLDELERCCQQLIHGNNDAHCEYMKTEKAAEEQFASKNDS